MPEIARYFNEPESVGLKRLPRVDARRPPRRQRAGEGRCDEERQRDRRVRDGVRGGYLEQERLDPSGREPRCAQTDPDPYDDQRDRLPNHELDDPRYARTQGPTDAELVLPIGLIAYRYRNLQITVLGPTVVTRALPDGVEAVAYNAAVVAAGGVPCAAPPPYSWTVSAGMLPPGLTLNADGTFTGTPTTAGSFCFTVEATDCSSPAGTASRDLCIDVTGVAAGVNLLRNDEVTALAPLAPAKAAIFTGTAGVLAVGEEFVRVGVDRRRGLAQQPHRVLAGPTAGATVGLERPHLDDRSPARP